MISTNEPNRLVPQPEKLSKLANDNTYYTSTNNPFMMPRLPMSSN